MIKDSDVNIRLGYVNVQGMKRALTGGELLEVIKGIDIMGVGETWLREGEEIILKNYIFEGKSKAKMGVRGRVPGGIGVLIRKEIKKRIIMEKTNMDELIWAIYRDGSSNKMITIGVIYKHPVGSVYFNDRFYEELEEEIIRMKVKYGENHLCILGDFNARVGINEPYTNIDNGNSDYENDKEEVRKRESKDKVMNNEGKKLIELCSKRNLYMLNGAVEGDWCGEFTFVNKNGCSVIDYVDFGAKRDEIRVEWRKLHNSEQHALYSSTNIISNFK